MQAPACERKNLRMSEASRSGIARGGRGIVGLEPH